MKTTLWRIGIIAAIAAYAALKLFGLSQPNAFVASLFTELFAYGMAVVVIYGVASLAFEQLWSWLAAGTVAGLVAGYLTAGTEHLGETALTVIAMIAAGTIIGVVIQRGYSPFRAYLASLIVATAFILIMLLPHWAELQVAAEKSRDLLVTDFETTLTASGYSPEMQESSRDTFKRGLDILIHLIPASTILSGVVQLSLGFLWFSVRTRRLYQRVVADPFVFWKVPFGLLPLVIVLALMRLFGNESLQLIADNGLVITAIFYCLAGLALVESTIRRLKVSWFMKGLFYLMLFLTQIFGFMLVSLLGFIDSFVDWRKIAAAKIALKS